MGLELWFDGSCGPVNPHGHTSYGLIVKENGRTVLEVSKYMGVGEGFSNNVGEFGGLIAALEYLIERQISHATIYGDSKLAVMQMNGQGKARSGMYVPYYKTAIALRKKLPDVKIKWIRRHLNKEADYLAAKALKGVPRSKSADRELSTLIKQQRADARRDGVPLQYTRPRPVRIIKKSEREAEDMRERFENAIAK